MMASSFSEMTDFEINIEVAKATGHKPLDEANGWKGLQDSPFSAVICKGPRRIGGFDPCNSWADAGPIIENENISLTCHQSRDEWAAIFNRHAMAAHSNPLRAAMECYLMKKGRENAS